MAAAKPVIPSLPNTFETGKGKRPRGVRALAPAPSRLRRFTRAVGCNPCRNPPPPQVPSFVPPSSDDLAGDGERFEKAVLDEVAQVGNVQYGLNKRERKAPDAAPAGDVGREKSFVEREMERKANDRESIETQQFREDVQARTAQPAAEQNLRRRNLPATSLPPAGAGASGAVVA